MITPVMLDGSPVGAVVVQKAASEPFLAGQLKITQSLSTQAGVFLNNLRQARRLVEADRISRELELAQTIQRQLLPAAEYDIEGLDLAAAYLATDRVGGDYYDVFQRSPSTVCALIADVSGHSVASGLMMTAARSAVRLIFEQTTRPSEILHRLNDALYGDLDQTGLFISMCIVVLDTDAKTAQYASAGHLPLLIYHDSSQEYEALDSTGLLLGIIPDARFDETVLSIARGDTAVLYTDGVTECRDSSGTFYGEERLRRLVADTAASDAQEIVRTVVSDLRAHTQGRLDDDVTLLVVKATSDW